VSSLRALLGRPVVATDSAEQLGVVDGVVVDPLQRRIVAVQLGGKGGRFVSWGDVRSVGSDAVMVSSSSAPREARDPWEQRAAAGVTMAPGTRLLDDGGDELGVVDDVEFDASTGALEALAVGDATVPSDRLRGVGSYAVVVDRMDRS
jgi:uncharacterized protein YrrD